MAWLALALIFSLWWPGFVALARLAVFRLRLPLMMAAPILWVGLEFIRAFLLTGFPWYYLGHSQFRFLTMIQIADTTSALGISFLIALVNAWILDLVSLPLVRTSAQGHAADPKTDHQTLDRDALDRGKPALWSFSPYHGTVPRQARDWPSYKPISSSGTRWEVIPS